MSHSRWFMLNSDSLMMSLMRIPTTLGELNSQQGALSISQPVVSSGVLYIEEHQLGDIIQDLRHVRDGARLPSHPAVLQSPARIPPCNSLHDFVGSL